MKTQKRRIFLRLVANQRNSKIDAVEEEFGKTKKLFEPVETDGAMAPDISLIVTNLEATESFRRPHPAYSKDSECYYVHNAFKGYSRINSWLGSIAPFHAGEWYYSDVGRPDTLIETWIYKFDADKKTPGHWSFTSEGNWRMSLSLELHASIFDRLMSKFENGNFARLELKLSTMNQRGIYSNYNDWRILFKDSVEGIWGKTQNQR